MESPLAKGLFKQVIGESGGAQYGSRGSRLSVFRHFPGDSAFFQVFRDGIAIALM
jgi:hypothetical protein